MTDHSNGTTKRSPARVRILLPTGFGINCEAETSFAFRLVGAEVDQLHINDLIAKPTRLSQCQILALAGGFSFGDHLGAGRALANRLRCRLTAGLERFVSDGGLILGICNGFQTMVRLGLLPAGRPGTQQVSLTHNAHGAFYDGWVSLSVETNSPCLFTRGLEQIDLPVRHGEGCLVIPTALQAEIDDNSLVPLRYTDPQTGAPTISFPHNPNGSLNGAAGLCDTSGRIFGLMPHPEAFLYPENHPSWRRRPRADRGDGIAIFENAVAACRG